MTNDSLAQPHQGLRHCPRARDPGATAREPVPSSGHSRDHAFSLYSRGPSKGTAGPTPARGVGRSNAKARGPASLTRPCRAVLIFAALP